MSGVFQQLLGPIMGGVALAAIKRGRADYRPLWGMVEASRRGDVEGYAIALVQMHDSHQRMRDELGSAGQPLDALGTDVNSVTRAFALLAAHVDLQAAAEGFTDPPWEDEALPHRPPKPSGRSFA